MAGNIEAVYMTDVATILTAQRVRPWVILSLRDHQTDPPGAGHASRLSKSIGALAITTNARCGAELPRSKAAC